MWKILWMVGSDSLPYIYTHTYAYTYIYIYILVYLYMRHFTAHLIQSEMDAPMVKSLRWCVFPRFFPVYLALPKESQFACVYWALPKENQYCNRNKDWLFGSEFEILPDVGRKWWFCQMYWTDGVGVLGGEANTYSIYIYTLYLYQYFLFTYHPFWINPLLLVVLVLKVNLFYKVFRKYMF